ncbi:MAG: ABC transporter permease [Pseudomonadota bacterium]
MTIGVASLVLVVSFMNAAEARLAGQIASVDGHIFVTGRGHRIEHPARLEQRLARIDGVEAATATLDSTGLITANGRSFAADLQGLDPSRMTTSPLFQRKAAIVFGKAPVRPATLAIGSDLAARLGVGIGEHAAITSIRHDGEIFTVANYDFIVSGIVSTDVYTFDSRRAIMPVDDLSMILGTKSAATRINVRLTNPDTQHVVVKAIQNILGDGYRLTTWQSMNSVLFSALKQDRLAMTIIISMVTLIALSNILSSMVMLVRYKAREIAILRTMGMSKKSIARVFVGVGAAIGLAGEAAGLGVGLTLKAAKDPITQALRTQIAHPSAELDVMLSLPLAISGGEITWIVALVSSGVLLSTLYPAVRAAAIDPASVLRHT